MRVLLFALLVAACGDNGIPPEPLFTGLSGSRIKLQWYLYQDGAKQLETAAFYDAHLHVRCEPLTWTDGVSRCSPIAEGTVFRDAACTMELGHSKDVRTPKYFIGRDRIDGELVAARLLRVGARVDVPPTAFFERRRQTASDEFACVQIAEPQTVSYFETAGEVAIGEMPEVWSERMEGERLGLRILAGIDELRAPIGYFDAELGVDCRPDVLPDGTTACVPTEAVPPAHFADPYCEQRLVVAEAPPRAVRVTDANGCAAYHGSADEHASLIYRREGTTCVRAFLQPDEHAYRVGAPLDLAPVARMIGENADHRLQRISISAGPMLTLDDRLYDTATRSDCRSIGNGELAICVPTNAATGARVFANDNCGREIAIADLPLAQCSRSAFAVVDVMSIHAIGAPYTAPLYTLDAGGNCRLRAAVPDTVPHLLGPPIPPQTFVAGVVYSER